MAHENIGQGRPLRGCPLCGGVDDHPRHVIGKGVLDNTAPSDEVVNKVISLAPEADRGRILFELFGSRGQSRHIDCCREAGCPDGSCNQLTAGVPALRGAALLDHLVGLRNG